MAYCERIYIKLFCWIFSKYLKNVILENGTSKYCKYDVFDAYKNQLVDNATATVNFTSKILQVNDVTKGHSYILKILGKEMTRIWNHENCRLNPDNLSYPAINPKNGSFEFNIAGKMLNQLASKLMI